MRTSTNPRAGGAGVWHDFVSPEFTESSQSPAKAQAAICILGVDPGLSGALAFYFPASPSHIVAEDIPVAGGAIDAATLAQRIAQMRPTMAVIELVGAMPKQGVSSTFKFGRAFGTVIGVVAALGIPTHFVAPTRWKRHFRLNANKDDARALALRLWPTAECFSRKKDHGRGEASLLARYGAETLHAATGISED